MATKIGSLFGDVSLRTANLDKNIAAVGKKLKKLGKSMSSVGKNLSMTLTAPIAALGVASLKTFGDFEKGMNEVKSLMPDLNQGEFADMSKDLRELSVEMGTNVVAATGALYQAISAGVPKENVMEFMRVASQSAIAGVTDMETAVDGLTTVLNAYKMDSSEAEKVSDILFTGVKLGKTNFEELSASMFQVAPMAAAMNIPLEEVTAAVATLTKQGVPTRVAMTQIRAALVSLQKPNADMVAAFGELGVSSGQALLDSKGLQGAFEALRTESGLSTAELTKAFGSVEAFGGVLGLTGENFEGAVSDLEAMTTAAGSMFEAFKENNEGLWADLQRLGAAFRDIGIEVGTHLAPIVADIAEKFKVWYSENKESIPGWVALGLKIAALVAVIGPILLVVGTMITAMGTLVSIFAMFTPVVLMVLGGLMLLGVAMKLAWEIGENFLGPAIVWMIDAFGGLWQKVKDVAGGFKNTLVGGLSAAFQSIKSFITGAIDKLMSKLNGLWDFFKKVSQTVGNFNPLRGAGEALGGAIGNVMYRAKGGPVSSGSPYIVGEQGPELFVPRYSGSIVPNDAMGGGGQTVNMTFNGVGMEMKAWLKNNQSAIAKIAVNAVSENNLRTV